MTISPRIWRPYTQMKLAATPLLVRSAAGAMLELSDGRSVIDSISSWWVIAHGHGEPAIVDAVREQAAKLDQVIFTAFTHEPAEALAEALVPLLPGQLSALFFSDDGSTAVEVALKMALQYHQLTGNPQRKELLCFEHAYHGDTFGAMSTSGPSSFTAPFAPYLFPVSRLRQPSQATPTAAEAYVSHLREVLEERGASIAALIIEPLVQGAGGMIMWPEEAVQRVFALCHEHGVLVIADEVMTGFGRTGELFATAKAGVQPDLLCLSKALTGGILPMGITAASETLYQAFLSDNPKEAFFHGHSFTANPLACAAAVANLRLFARKPMRQLWTAIEEGHRAHLSRLAEHPLVAAGRSCGTIGALTLQSSASGYFADIGKRLAKHALDHGVFLRPLGNVVYLLPPYCISAEQLALCYRAIESFLLEQALP